MQLTGIKEISGTIVLKSGLHIGGGDMEMRIGGTDNTVIKHPHTQEPYIPGSSLKGKVRSLLEMRSGLMEFTGGDPLSIKTWQQLKKLKEKEKTEEGRRFKSFQIKECVCILKLFGSGGDDSESEEAKTLGPTRVSFTDCTISKKWREAEENNLLPLIEVKSENRINRIKGTAEHPRFTERVPAYTEFSFSILLKNLDQEHEKDLEELLLVGLKLLSLDTLGGNGSRGYGRIAFEFDQPAEYSDKFETLNPLERIVSQG